MNSVRALWHRVRRSLAAEVARVLHAELDHRDGQLATRLDDSQRRLDSIEALVQKASRTLDETRSIATDHSVQTAAAIRAVQQLTANSTLDMLALQDLSAGQWHETWQSIDRDWDCWRECKVVYACAMSFKAAHARFPDARVHRIDRVSDFYGELASLDTSARSAIGIVSPALVMALMTHPHVISLLSRAIRQKLLLVQHHGTDAVRIRRELHRHGFHETTLSRPAAGSSVPIECSTVGVMPDGDFDFRSTTPGLPMAGPGPHLLVAWRGNAPVPARHVWMSLLGRMGTDWMGVSKSTDEGEAISCAPIAECGATAAGTCWVEATFVWISPGPGAASLLLLSGGDDAFGQASGYEVELQTHGSTPMDAQLTVREFGKAGAVLTSAAARGHPGSRGIELRLRLLAGPGTLAVTGPEGEIARLPLRLHTAPLDWIGLRSVHQAIGISNVEHGRGCA